MTRLVDTYLLTGGERFDILQSKHTYSNYQNSRKVARGASATTTNYDEVRESFVIDTSAATAETAESDCSRG